MPVEKDAYDVENRSLTAPGRPPPPPPTGRKWQRLEALRAEDARRRRQWLTGIAAGLALILAGVGMGMWIRSRADTADPKIIAKVDDTQREGADGKSGEADPDAEGERPDERSGGSEQTTVADKPAPAGDRENADTTGGAQEKKERAGEPPTVDSSSEKTSSEPASQENRSESGDKPAESPRPADDDRAPKLDGQVLLPDPRSSAAVRLYYLDAIDEKVLAIPTGDKTVQWDLLLPADFSRFEVTPEGAVTKTLRRKDLASGTGGPVFALTAEKQADALLLKMNDLKAVPGPIHWCVLSVAVENSPAAQLFALQGSKIRWHEANFAKSKCTQPLPGVSGDMGAPALRIESVAIRLNDFDPTFVFEPPSEAKATLLPPAVLSPALEDIARRKLQIQTHASLEFTQSKADVTFSIKTSPPIEKQFNSFVKSQIDELEKNIKDFSRQNPRIRGLADFKARRMENEWKKDNTDYAEDVENLLARTLADCTNATANTGATIPGIDSLNAARKRVADVRALMGQFLKFRDSLDNAEIVSACLYYEVATPNRKQPTKIYLRFSKGSE